MQRTWRGLQKGRPWRCTKSASRLTLSNGSTTLQWVECLSSLQSGYNLSEVEKNGFSTWYLQGFERRFHLMKRELGFATREALEVLANSARQLSEIRTFLASFWSDLASRASVLNRDDQAEFYRARFEVVFTPLVEVFLGTAGARAGPGTFGPTSAGQVAWPRPTDACLQQHVLLVPSSRQQQPRLWPPHQPQAERARG